MCGGVRELIREVESVLDENIGSNNFDFVISPIGIMFNHAGGGFTGHDYVFDALDIAAIK